MTKRGTGRKKAGGDRTPLDRAATMTAIESTNSPAEDCTDDDQSFAERFGFGPEKGYGAIIAESYSGARAPYVNVQLDSQPTALKASVGTDGGSLDDVSQLKKASGGSDMRANEKYENSAVSRPESLFYALVKQTVNEDSPN